MEEVEVLYDYVYSDEQGLVEIRRGERYKLIEKTNSEWWHVCVIDKSVKKDQDVESIFVPAQYVRLLRSDEDVKNALSQLDSVLDDEIIHSSATYTDGDIHSKRESFSSQNKLGKAVDSEMDYVNLEEFRANAKILTLSTDGNCDYANLPFQTLNQSFPAQDQKPSILDGKFVRVLLEGLPWDIYEDKSKRKFFHNRETEEITWKPPRKDKPTSPVSTTTVTTAFPCEMHDSASSQGDLPADYTKQEESGEVFFINNFTREKWQQLVDTNGRQYFHQLGSSDTFWQLPTRSQLKVDMSEGTEHGLQTEQEDVSSPVVGNRQSKAKSMYGKIERNSATTNVEAKACTLPYNFSPSNMMEKSLSLPTFQLQAETRLEDQHLHGYLNRAKLADTGKKKIKKTWIPAYLVLQGSNLVFYKDHKAATQKPGSPHGKPELVLSLHGAQVNFNLPKDVTSRRNTIMLIVSTGSQLLLHSDDEKNIHEWLVALKLAANDIDIDPKEGTLSRKGTARSLSETGFSSGNDADRNKSNIVGIRAKLMNLLTRRPTQDELVKQGIFKDAVFGSSLQDLCERDSCVVPNFVLECIAAVENRGLSHDGLYRISGNLAEIQRLRCLIDKDESYSLAEDSQWDVHTLTGALKLFFRELREPLFTFRFVHKFIEAIKKESRRDKLKGMQEAISSLMKCNQETMRVLFQHLINVVQFSSENRMQTQNIAIVFGPTLMWLGEEDFSKMAVFTIYQSKVVEFILLEYDNLFHF